MSVKDVIKKGVLDNFGGGSGLDISQICLILLISCLVGIYIFIVYKHFFKAAFYSKDLNVTLAGMTVIVAAIMVAMQSNLLVSLGMVGALSIVRFRTAVKNPMDLLYLFWSISAGIICGVGLHVLAIVLCAVMTLIIWIMNIIPGTKAPYVLVVKSKADIDTSIVDTIIFENSKYRKLCTSSIKNNQSECIYEIKTTDKTALVKEISKVDGILGVSILEHDGELRA